VGRLRGGAIIGDISGAALAGSVIWKLVLIRRFVFLFRKIQKNIRNLHLSCWCLSDFISMLYINLDMSEATPHFQTSPFGGFVHFSPELLGKKPNTVQK
jgi:hypothetical protein